MSHLFSGAVLVLCFLLLFLSLAGRRRRNRTVLNRRTNQYERKPLFGATLGYPVQQGPALTSPYRSQGLAQAASGIPPSVQHDPLLYNDDYYSQSVPPPAYDPNVKDVYFSVSSTKSIILHYIQHPLSNLPETIRKVKGLVTFLIVPCVHRSAPI